MAGKALGSIFGNPKGVFLSLLVGLASAALVSAATASTGMLGEPALSKDQLAFVHAGDIWIASPDGTNARRLTSSPATESGPFFSPDGQFLAFTANYEGNPDVFVIASAGGQPRRLTWHPGSDVATGWTPDGASVVLVSDRGRASGRSGQLYHIGLTGGLPEKQMEARIFRGSYDATGQQLAYIPFGSGYNGLFGGSSGWKGYRGGTTPAIHIMNLDAQSVEVVPGAQATNFSPQWLDGVVYFLSDRKNKTFNIFRYDSGSGELQQLSHEPLWDVRAFSLHGARLVYEAGRRLHEVDLQTGDVSTLGISISPDLPQMRARWKSVAANLEHAQLSPTGKRVLVNARGEVFSLPIEKGTARNLSRSPGVREYSALWSPDGNRVAWVEESRTGQSLVIADQFGTVEGKPLPLGSHFYQLRAWASGESQRIIFEDNHLGLHQLELKGGRQSKIDTEARRYQMDTAVSPDGRWLAYTASGANHQSDLFLYDLQKSRRIPVTDGRADVAAPVFSRDGKYLYFAASTNAGPIKAGLNMNTRERPYRAGLYALVLADNAPSPLVPESGDEGDEAQESADEGSGGKGDAKEDAQPDPVRVDVDGLFERIVALPVAQRNYEQLRVGADDKLYYLEIAQPGISVEPPETENAAQSRLMRFDFESRESSSLADNVQALQLSHDGNHLLAIRSNNTLASAELAEKLELEDLDTHGLRLQLEPRREWRQIFDEVWRMEKEYFYAKNLHGLNWDAIYKQYLPLLEYVGRREDLNDLMVQMIAEMYAGHNRVGGGDVHVPDKGNHGLLGADYQIEKGRYRLQRVYAAGAWHPWLKAPLAGPGNSVSAGEYLLAIDGRELRAQDNIHARLQGTLGRQVSLRVGPRADGRNARELVVEPISDERQLRLWDWIENNRRRVAQRTDGKVGYIYLPNTAGAGYTFFNRMFYAQVDKQALIVDERSNAGGQAADYLVEVLGRRHLSGWQDRDGLHFNTPMGAVHGPKLMLIDQDAGSGGDFLPYAFRHWEIGKLMGTRTWGGLIGISANPDLVDGGRLTVPFFRYFDPELRWSIENEGVAPDIEVELDPLQANRGVDSQLEAGIDEILSQLADFKSDVPDKAPPLPTQLGD